MSQKKSTSLLITVLLSTLAAVSFFPIYLAVINSFKTQGEMFRSFVALPSKIHFSNYVDAFRQIQLLHSTLNSIIISVVGRMAKALSVQGSTYGLAIIYIGLGVNMAIFLYHGFVKSIPRELEEAAQIDGCNEFQTFFKIIFPLLVPITVTIAILDFLWIWNDFLLPLLMLTDVDNYTLILSTNTLFGEYNKEWSLILAALVLTAIPVIIIYSFFQKFIMHGIAEGAIKG